MTWQKNLRKVEPYVSGEQPQLEQMIKLNTNESPYPPSPKVGEVLKTLDIAELRLYPNVDADELRAALSKLWQFPAEQIFVGNGSDEVLSLSFLTFFNSEKPILMPDVTYAFYPTYCDLYGIKYKKIPVADNFHLVLKDYFQENGGIVFANPNNPTGLSEDLDFIVQILGKNSESIVIIDEAYADFSGVSALPLLDKYENLIITRTFSKSRSLAGARLGVALGSPLAIAKLYDVKNSFNSYCVDAVAQQMGLASVLDEDYLQKTVHKIIRTRDNFTVELRALGFEVLDSQTNFVLIKHPKISGRLIFEQLYAAHIIVRRWEDSRIAEWLRISIGTDEEMAHVIDFFKAIL